MRKEITKAQFEAIRRESHTCQVCKGYDERCRYARPDAQGPMGTFCPTCDPTQTYNRFYARIPKADPMQEYHWAEYLEGIYGLE